MAERELIAAIEGALAQRSERVERWLGDDAAVVRAGRYAVTSVDAIADGVHFDLTTHSPEDVGHKALAAALSDLAAMGVGPGEAYVALALPAALSGDEALRLVTGMEALAERTGTAIAGGDVVSAASLVVSVTVTGWVESQDAAVGRDGAGSGELVGVTGALGAAGAGLLLLGGAEAALDREAREALVERQRRPEPRLEAGQALARAGVSAMIDLSDGLAADLAHLAESSGARIRIELADVPLAEGVAEVARACGREPGELGASAGEDYELAFTIDPAAREAAERAAGDVTWLGSVSAGSGLELRSEDGSLVSLGGFEHR